MNTPSPPQSKLTFFLNAKLHEDLKIRMYYDGMKTQSEFFRLCVESYLAKDKFFMEFLDEHKVNKKVQSKKKVGYSRKLRESGQQLMRELALTEEDVENIFDILEEELPEL
jgi:hypothetical protein